MEELSQLIKKILECGALKKIILSKPKDKTVKRAEGRIILVKDIRTLQIETFYTDGKARHKNVPEKEGAATIGELFPLFGQINIFTTGGDCEVLFSSKGKCRIKNNIHTLLVPVRAGENNKERHYLLDPAIAAPFLSKLGVCSENGQIYDKKRSKFKQINRFIEILDDVYTTLPGEGKLTVCDLCCGKSYLTFAVYFYLTTLRGREVQLYGVDLKNDVIEFCKKTAEELEFDGMDFHCMNIFDFNPKKDADLVISLHACDIATDMVLYNAIRLHAKVILSTPCCHHEMMNQLNCSALEFVSAHSMFRQKMCDALTDALRCKRLEAEGYKVTAIELIDPEETPKNILIRAVKGHTSKQKREQALAEYKSALAFLNVTPYLDKLLEKDKME